MDANANGTAPLDGIEKAIEESKVAITLDPNSLETHRARGYVLENTGNYEEAIREYEAAIAINENIADLASCSWTQLSHSWVFTIRLLRNLQMPMRLIPKTRCPIT